MTSQKNASSKKVLCIMGPTASGKTSLAVEAAKRLNGEVVSVDSALVYRDMNIGTAKPSLEEQKGVPHHLIDIIIPELSYSVADFMKDAVAAIEDILHRDKLPILAGGTMMYFNALINGIHELPAANQDIRDVISNLSLPEIYKRVQKIDPVSAQRIHQSDAQRLSRALEVYMASGKTLSYWQNKDKQNLPYNFVQFSIMPKDRAMLHQLIEIRFELMLENGFVDEVKNLLQKYELHDNLPSMRSVGYRQVKQYLGDQLSYEDMQERGVIATRQLAKRQITWLRSWQNLSKLTSGDAKNLEKIVEKMGARHHTIM